MARPSLLNRPAAVPAAAPSPAAAAGGGEAQVCPLCGHRFRLGALRCHDGCPLARRCQVICCPRCGYEFVDAEGLRRRLGRVRGVFRRLLRIRS